VSARLLAVLACAGGLALSGCGGSDQSNTSTAGASAGDVPTAARDFVDAPNGKVPKGAPSSAAREIPTQFDRAASLPNGSTVLIVAALDATNGSGDPSAADGGGRTAGILVGIRNEGSVNWTGVPSQIGKLAIGSGTTPQRTERALGADVGPCPATGPQSDAPVSNEPLTVAAEGVAVVCFQFPLPAGQSPILFKFAPRASEYTLQAADEGGEYGVWALPGTVLEKCLYSPGDLTKDLCHEVEADE
jgi:hypothetical protein